MTSILAGKAHFDQALSDDAFLGGRLRLWQPVKGYRAGIDPVLLAACVPAQAGQHVLDLGCGAGTAALCLGTRVAGLNLTGLERQQFYADLAMRNAFRNDLEMTVHCVDLRLAKPLLGQQVFDHIIVNPPFFDPARRTQAADAGREEGLAEETPLTDWIDLAARRLRPKGLLHLIHRAERLPDILAACSDRLGALEVLPLAPRIGRAAQLVLLRARKGGRTAFRLHAPLILHGGKTHISDGDDYDPAISGILRDGQMLTWP